MELKKNLKKLNQESLINLVVDLYQKNKQVKEQLDFYFTPNEAELLKIYKNKVLEAFYPKRGDKFQLKKGKQAISDFKKLKPRIESVVDLMIYYVECGVLLTREYGDINEPFYFSLESVYISAMKIIRANDLLELFKDRAFRIIEDTKDIGWGFHDFLADVYWETYGE